MSFFISLSGQSIIVIVQSMDFSFHSLGVVLLFSQRGQVQENSAMLYMLSYTAYKTRAVLTRNISCVLEASNSWGFMALRKQITSSAAKHI